jgi:hypothetical protein
MGLLDKLFNQPKDARRSEVAESTQFRETPESAPAPVEDDENGARSTPRRDLVQVVLRETMRKHGIPSDWMDCLILSVVSKSRGTGMHVQLVVKQGDDRLVTYVHAFQESFLEELARFDRKARDQVFSLSWQFQGKPAQRNTEMPEPASWGGKPSAPAPLEMPGRTPKPAPKEAEPDEDLQKDLQALFAIRDAALSKQPPPDPDRPDFEPTRPGGM